MAYVDSFGIKAIALNICIHTYLLVDTKRSLSLYICTRTFYMSMEQVAWNLIKKLDDDPKQIQKPPIETTNQVDHQLRQRKQH